MADSIRYEWNQDISEWDEDEFRTVYVKLPHGYRYVSREANLPGDFTDCEMVQFRVVTWSEAVHLEVLKDSDPDQSYLEARFRRLGTSMSWAYMALVLEKGPAPITLVQDYGYIPGYPV